MSRCLGFGSKGPKYDSFASHYQSYYYGGETPSGGWFACCQRRGMRSECKCSPCCYSLMIFILGISFITSGVMMYYYPDSIDPTLYYNIYFTNQIIFKVERILIAIGVFMCLSSFCGCETCIGQWFLLIIFILIITSIVFLSIIVNDLRNGKTMENNMKSELKLFDDTDNSILARMQQDLHCCGILNSSDWQENTLFTNGSVPDSCCRNVTIKCGISAQPGQIFHDGCLALAQDYVRLRILALLLLAILCVIVVLRIGSSCFIDEDEDDDFINYLNHNIKFRNGDYYIRVPIELPK